MDRTQAVALIKESIHQIVPDADFSVIGLDDKFREVLELDSLDFLSLVELLAQRTGVRIDEDDYPRLTTLADGAGFLVERSG